MATVDKGWSWVVLVASFSASGLLFGLSKCAGVMYTVLPKAYGINRSEAATITILFSSLMSAFGVVSGMLLKYLSTRKVVLLAGLFSAVGLLISSMAKTATLFLFGYGIIFAIGGGLTVVPSRIVLMEYFKEKLNLAIGLSLTGSCVGGIFIPPLMEKLESNYGFSSTMLIFTGIILHIIPAALTFFPQEKKKKKSEDVKSISGQVTKPNVDEKDRKKKCSCPLDFSVLLDFNYIAIVFSTCTNIVGFTAVGISLLDYAINELHETRSRAILLSSGLSTGDLVGRMFMAIFNSKFRLKRFYVLSHVALALVTFLIPVFNSFWATFAFSCLYGVVFGTIAVSPQLLINRYIEHKKMAPAFSILALFISFPVMATAPLVAIMRDAIGSYVPCFYTASLVTLAAILPWGCKSFIPIKKKKRVYWLTTDREKPIYRLKHSEVAFRSIF